MSRENIVIVSISAYFLVLLLTWLFCFILYVVLKVYHAYNIGDKISFNELPDTTNVEISPSIIFLSRLQHRVYRFSLWTFLLAVIPILMWVFLNALWHL